MRSQRPRRQDRQVVGGQLVNKRRHRILTPQHLAHARLQGQPEHFVKSRTPQIEVHQNRSASRPSEAHGQLGRQGGLSFAARGAGNHEHARLLHIGLAEHAGRDAVDRLRQSHVPGLVPPRRRSQPTDYPRGDQRHQADDRQSKSSRNVRAVVDSFGLHIVQCDQRRRTAQTDQPGKAPSRRTASGSSTAPRARQPCSRA